MKRAKTLLAEHIRDEELGRKVPNDHSARRQESKYLGDFWRTVGVGCYPS